MQERHSLRMQRHLAAAVNIHGLWRRYQSRESAGLGTRARGAPPTGGVHPAPGLRLAGSSPSDPGLGPRVPTTSGRGSPSAPVLLLGQNPEPGSRAPPPAMSGPPGLDAWRARVRKDPRHFLHLCADLDCTPDIWALHDWSSWLTPFTREGLRRFDTAFYLCCLHQAPPVYPDAAEVVGCQWLSPSEAIKSFISKEIWLAPPQFYEMRRLENFVSLSDLHKFCLDRSLEGVQRLLPITLLTADGMVQLLPGDELYLEDSKFLEELISTEKKNEEIMKEGKKFHRVVIYNRHLYGIYVTLQSKYKHVYPENYIVNKSQL
ncbi:PREDICTED: nucleoside diphosphate-linked moiety X motif 19, mitochondrial [Condylura cristata]|uniref:nucleoside diphosphate-linked moiety X motif 19, mitochondrial n=1 Tax=Condylura cristata TaxID=143302 RepID=UPI000643407D|nr:PREDICTED: nucleoside diphosphate-linked moiety X motif 19, mitochondrial [Condylura cristata]